MILTVTLNPSVDVWLDVSRLRLGRFHRMEAVSRSPGGKGVNVSRVIRALGGSTVALMAAGGSTRLEIKRLLAKENVAVRILPCAGETRTNYKVRSKEAAQTTELNAAGLQLSQAALRRFSALLGRLLPRAACVVFAGSVPEGVPAATYRDWILRAHRAGVPAVLDASGQLLSCGLTGKPWLVKPNREEAQELLGYSIRSLRQAKRAVKALCVRGAAMAVLSLGKEGALWASHKDSRVWMASPPHLRVNSTVGSGDALLGGLLDAWARGLPWPQALAFGVACGSAAAQKPPGIICTPQEAARLLSRVRLKPL